MKTATKRAMLEAMLNSQDLGKKGVDNVLYCFDNDISLPQNIDPLTQFIFNSVMAEDDIDGLKTTLNYAIHQITGAKEVIDNF